MQLTCFVERIKTMMRRLWNSIFGVPRESIEAAPRLRAEVPAMFLPEHKVPAGGIDGVAEDGSTWAYWRSESNTGLRWFRRVSATPGDGSLLGAEADQSDIPDEFFCPSDEELGATTTDETDFVGDEADDIFPDDDDSNFGTYGDDFDDES